MIHTDPADAAHVSMFHGEGIDTLTGSIRGVEDGKQSYVMILIPYPKEMVSGLIHSLTHGY